MKTETMNRSSIEEELKSADSSNEAVDLGNCCSSEILLVQPLAVGIGSAREVCIAVLKDNRVLVDDQHTSTCTPLKVKGQFKVQGGEDAIQFMKCKVCSIVGSPRKMLICDFCEEAFHLHCCNEKEPFSVDWYCQPCLTNELTASRESGDEKPFANMYGDFKREMMRHEIGDVPFMLKDTRPHISKVRIGNDFQVQVPDWSGPVTHHSDCLPEPLELQPEDWSDLDGWKFKKAKKDSISNWIQCRERMDDVLICGKWRRLPSKVMDLYRKWKAPLPVTQTDDWDCSCSVVWDPIHADCAVPQEVETEDVLKQLKYLESLKSRMQKKRKSPCL